MSEISVDWGFCSKKAGVKFVIHCDFEFFILELPNYSYEVKYVSEYYFESMSRFSLLLVLPFKLKELGLNEISNM